MIAFKYLDVITPKENKVLYCLCLPPTMFDCYSTDYTPVERLGMQLTSRQGAHNGHG